MRGDGTPFVASEGEGGMEKQRIDTSRQLLWTPTITSSSLYCVLSHSQPRRFNVDDEMKGRISVNEE